MAVTTKSYVNYRKSQITHIDTIPYYNPANERNQYIPTYNNHMIEVFMLSSSVLDNPKTILSLRIIQD